MRRLSRKGLSPVSRIAVRRALSRAVRRKYEASMAKNSCIAAILGIHFVVTVKLRDSIQGPIMQKMLIKHGNSLALVIDKPILDLLQISVETPLELTTNGDQLLVTPCRDKSRQRKVADSLKEINGKFGNDLKRLAE